MAAATIQSVKARQIFDSHGNPTVEAVENVNAIIGPAPRKSQVTALKELYKSFTTEYPIVSIQDPFDLDDWEHYAKMTADIGDKVQRSGDDLLVSNPKVSRENFFHGETEDTFIADLSVGLATGQIKTGAPCRSERLAKYNQLLPIEEELGADAVYAGANFRAPVEPY